MDLITRLLLGVTALAVLAYMSFIYGSCAGDPDCHVRTCGRQLCGVVYSHPQDRTAPWNPIRARRDQVLTAPSRSRIRP